MPFTKIVLCIVVEEHDHPRFIEEIDDLLDSFMVRRIPIFDSDISTTSTSEVEDADEIRREMLKLDEKI